MKSPNFSFLRFLADRTNGCAIGTSTLVEFIFRLEKRITLKLTLFLRINKKLTPVTFFDTPLNDEQSGL